MNEARPENAEATTQTHDVPPMTPAHTAALQTPAYQQEREEVDGQYEAKKGDVIQETQEQLTDLSEDADDLQEEGSTRERTSDKENDNF